MIVIRFLWLALTVILYECIALPLAVLGLFLVPLAIAFRQLEPARAAPGRVITNAPRWLWLWGNDEDGYQPDWYAAAHPQWSAWRRMYIWAAIRNSVNNLRFVRALHPPPNPARYRTWRRGVVTLIWQGWASRLIVNERTWWLAIGWKYDPDSEPAYWQQFGCGFGIRLKRYTP